MTRRQDESEEREWDDIIDKLAARGTIMKEEKIEKDRTQLSIPSSHDSNGAACSRLPTRSRRRGASIAADRPAAADCGGCEPSWSLINKKLMIHLKLSGEKLTQERLRKPAARQHVHRRTAAGCCRQECGGKLSTDALDGASSSRQPRRGREQQARKKERTSTTWPALYQVSSTRGDSNQLQLEQHELDAIIASSQADSLNGSQDSTTSRAQPPYLLESLSRTSWSKVAHRSTV